MDDCEKISDSCPKPRKSEHDINERDDFGGMILNMFNKVDPRAIMIVFISYIFLHTELCAENVMKKMSGCLNEDGSLTMKGTIYSAFVMTFIAMLCMIIF